MVRLETCLSASVLLEGTARCFSSEGKGGLVTIVGDIERLCNVVYRRGWDLEFKFDSNPAKNLSGYGGWISTDSVLSRSQPRSSFLKAGARET